MHSIFHYVQVNQNLHSPQTLELVLVISVLTPYHTLYPAVDAAAFISDFATMRVVGGDRKLQLDGKSSDFRIYGRNCPGYTISFCKRLQLDSIQNVHKVSISIPLHTSLPPKVLEDEIEPIEMSHASFTRKCNDEARVI